MADNDLASIVENILQIGKPIYFYSETDNNTLSIPGCECGIVDHCYFHWRTECNDIHGKAIIHTELMDMAEVLIDEDCLC